MLRWQLSASSPQRQLALIHALALVTHLRRQAIRAPLFRLKANMHGICAALDGLLLRVRLFLLPLAFFVNVIKAHESKFNVTIGCRFTVEVCDDGSDVECLALLHEGARRLQADINISRMHK